MTTTPAAVDLDAMQARRQGRRSAGDGAVGGTTLQLTGEMLRESVDISAGERVLDVAAGNRNAAAADAEALPFPDAAFDVVLSTFGVMFAPRQERVAAELLRVCRPGGRIGLANWTPESFVGRMFRVVGRHVPTPAGLRSPLEWGTRARLGELFGTRVESIGVRSREVVLRYRSARHWLDAFRDSYGPTRDAFAALDDAGRTALEHDLLALAHAHNTSGPDALRIPSEYLEVVVVKAG